MAFLRAATSSSTLKPAFSFTVPLVFDCKGHHSLMNKTNIYTRMKQQIAELTVKVKEEGESKSRSKSS